MVTQLVASSAVHGPEITRQGVHYRLWCPDAHSVRVLVNQNRKDAGPREMDLAPESGGWFSALDESGVAGDLYCYSIDGGEPLPDVASRFQPQGVRGPSQIIDASGYEWNDALWKRPVIEDLVLYELHVGTFTEAGTFASAIGWLEELRRLGVNAIQLMPVAAFPGERNWGYDVALPFAPANAYGTPDDLRRLVDAAHGHGIAVILDVVYNHVCGEPNFFEATSRRYFRASGGSAWGRALNFDGPDSGDVRACFIQNICYWMEQFHVDGFRLDATHAILDESPVHILREITDAVHHRGGMVIAEDDRNDASLIASSYHGGQGMDAVWADDFHHVMRMALHPETIGYFKSYAGTNAELADAIENGWLYRGQEFPHWNRPRGTPCREMAPSQFVYCISNHDQAGNRPLGERLNHLISPEAYRAASMFFLLLPYTPMIFMGQEWAADAPFCFFSNHGGEFGNMVDEGRRREFQNFGAHWPPAMLAEMPNPEDADAFNRSKLDHSEAAKPAHASILALYRACLDLRARDPVLHYRERDHWHAWAQGDLVFVGYGPSRMWTRLLVCRLEAWHQQKAGATEPVDIRSGWKLLLSSNEARFGGNATRANRRMGETIALDDCETILLGKVS